MKRAVRYGLYGLAALAVLAVGAVLVFIQILDRPRMAAEIQTRLSHAVQGEVRWKDFSVSLLPAPRARVSALRVETAAATLTADEVKVALKLWPLFRGRAEIAALELARPALSMTVVPEASKPAEAQSAPAQGPLAEYRAIMSALADALKEFAPETVMAIDDAGVKVTVEGMPTLELAQLRVRGRTGSDGVELDASAASPYWNGMKLAGRLRYADLSSTAELHLTRIQGKAWLDWLLKPAGIGVDFTEVDLDIGFRGDPAKTLEADVAGSAKTLVVTRAGELITASPVALKAAMVADADQVLLKLDRLGAGATGLADGTLTYAPKDGSVGGDVGYQVDLAQALGYARAFVPLEYITSASGALRGRLKPAVRGGDWRVAATVESPDAAVELKDVAGALRLTNAAIDADAHNVQAQGVALSLPAGSLRVTRARYAFEDGAVAAAGDFDLDVAATIALVRAVAPKLDLSIVESSGGRLRGSANGESAGKKWSAGLRVANSNAQVKLKPLPAPLELSSAALEADARQVRAENVLVALPAGKLALAKGHYGLRDGAAAADAQFELDVAETMKLVRAALPDLDLSIVESAGGQVRGRASAGLTGKEWTAAVDIAQSDAQAKLKPLPAPVKVSRVTLRATPQAITVERAEASLLDSSASASATIKGADIRGSIAQATIGAQLLDWIWQSNAIAPRFEPKAPIRLAVPQFGWNGKSMELRGDARLDAGPAVSVDARWQPEALEVRRVNVKDAHSDVTVAVRTKGSLIDGSYAGTLDSRTLAAMLKSASAPAGAVSGDLRFTFDRNNPRAIQANGNLKGSDIDLTWLAGKPAKLARLDLSADGASVHVGEATLDWAGQLATLRGQMKRGDAGPVIDASIESPGMIVDALLPEKTAAPPKPAAKSSPFPLPVTGRISVRSQFLQYQTYRAEPVRALVTLEPQRVLLEVDEALVCGLALPLTLEMKPAGYAARGVINAQKQKLEETAKCLSQENLLITGPMDLRVDVRTEGQGNQLLQNLQGTISADVRNGTVTKFALLGNILSMQNVVALATEGGPKLGSESFPFRQLSAKGHFEKGRIYIDEGVFHSNAIGLGANGWISLTDFQSRLTVLVAPLALVDEAVRKLPVLGYVVGGTFTSLPVGVSGDIRDPTVVPLGPRAITDEMMGLLGRTLTLPTRVVPGKD